jgi:hypothetical protein
MQTLDVYIYTLYIHDYDKIVLLPLSLLSLLSICDLATCVSTCYFSGIFFIYVGSG